MTGGIERPWVLKSDRHGRTSQICHFLAVRMLTMSLCRSQFPHSVVWELSGIPCVKHLICCRLFTFLIFPTVLSTLWGKRIYFLPLCKYSNAQNGSIHLAQWRGTQEWEVKQLLQMSQQARDIIPHIESHVVSHGESDSLSACPALNTSYLFDLSKVNSSGALFPSVIKWE